MCNTKLKKQTYQIKFFFEKALENNERKELKQKALKISEELKDCDIIGTSEIVQRKMKTCNEKVEEKDEIPSEISDDSDME